MNIKWTDKITREELWRITKQKQIEIQIKRRKWNWIGHTLRKEAGAVNVETEKDVKGKGKAIPLQAWRGPEGSRRLRLPDFNTVST